jgi:hypothetical protein
VNVPIFKITIRPHAQGAWPVAIEQRSGNDYFPLGVQGRLELDLAELLARSADRLSYGTLLGQALFCDAVYDLFVAALSRAPDRLHLRLTVEDQALRHNVIWGRLCAPIDGIWRFVQFNQRLAAAQLISSRSTRVFPTVSTRDLATLVVAASPADPQTYQLQPFDAAAFAARIAAALPGRHVQRLVSGTGEPPALDALCRRLEERPYAVLHLIAHGRFDTRQQETVLYLERPDGSGATDPVSGARLIERLAQLSNLPQLIVLEACASAAGDGGGAISGLAQRLIDVLGIPAVLAMSDRISMQTAERLGAALYARLTTHGAPDRALSEALTTVAEQPDTLIPAIFTRLEASALFTRAPMFATLTGADPRSLRICLNDAFTPAELEQLTLEINDELERTGVPLLVHYNPGSGRTHLMQIVDLLDQLQRYEALACLIAAMRRARPELFSISAAE